MSTPDHPSARASPPPRRRRGVQSSYRRVTAMGSRMWKEMTMDMLAIAVAVLLVTLGTAWLVGQPLLFAGAGTLLAGAVLALTRGREIVRRYRTRRSSPAAAAV